MAIIHWIEMLSKKKKKTNSTSYLVSTFYFSIDSSEPYSSYFYQGLLFTLITIFNTIKMTSQLSCTLSRFKH